ncbi:MAG: hypothetical protein MJ247_06095 [Alphaproteobacteria bacterium]|nr:hypothetical protein [Alphaproteobacteria bacterium]
MTDMISTLPEITLPRSSINANTLTIEDAPEVVCKLPYYSELSARIQPSKTLENNATLVLNLPEISVTGENEKVLIPINFPFRPDAPIDLIVRTLPAEKNTAVLKLLFSNNQYNLNTHIQKNFSSNNSNNQKLNSDNIINNQIKTNVEDVYSEIAPIKTVGFVIKLIPDHIFKIVPEINNQKNFKMHDVKMELEITPSNQNSFTERLNAFIDDPTYEYKIPEETAETIEPEQEIAQEKVQNQDDGINETTPAKIQPIIDDDIDVDELLFKKLRKPSEEGTNNELNDDQIDDESEAAQTLNISENVEESVSLNDESMTSAIHVLKNNHLNNLSINKDKAEIDSVKSNAGNEQVNIQEIPEVDEHDKEVMTRTTINNLKNCIEERIDGFIYHPTNSKMPIVVTKIGAFALETNNTIPDLSTITVKIKNLEIPLEQNSLNSIIEDGENLPHPFKNDWKALGFAIDRLNDADEKLANSFKDLIPQPNPRLASALINFIRTHQSNFNFASWAGENAYNILSKIDNGSKLINKIEKDFKLSSKKAVDKSGNPWKAYDIPILNGNAIEPVSLYIWRNSEIDEELLNKVRIQTEVRFVLDLNLSKMGKLQLEGLANRSKKTFALTIKHEHNLPKEFAITCQDIFNQTLSAMAYNGTLSVKQSDEFIKFYPAEAKQTSGYWA